MRWGDLLTGDIVHNKILKRTFIYIKPSRSYYGIIKDTKSGDERKRDLNSRIAEVWEVYTTKK